ncbi:MAG TPA: hypothetical protein PKY30_12380 [Myxococcota bacterium]|nr:hypothetical protein [Myxococcota bacterium]HNH47833.1 hypothetical protein [Myxococcota bacterium]
MSSPEQTDFSQLLSTLFPDREIRITDVLGNEYTSTAVLSAKREEKLLRVLTRLHTSPIVGMAADLPTGAPQQQLQGLLGILLSAVQEDSGILGILEEAFCVVHPKVWAEVQGKEADFEKDGEVFTPGDAFSIMEMATAILPFVVKPAQKILGALKAVQKPPKS